MEEVASFDPVELADSEPEDLLDPDAPSKPVDDPDGVSVSVRLS